MYLFMHRDIMMHAYMYVCVHVFVSVFMKACMYLFSMFAYRGLRLGKLTNMVGTLWQLNHWPRVLF
jgi:hypothetical protein